MRSFMLTRILSRSSRQFGLTNRSKLTAGFGIVNTRMFSLCSKLSRNNQSFITLSVQQSTVTSPRKFRERIAPIQLTERAAERIKELMQGKDSNIVGVKIGVKRRGCNGYSYNMNYATVDELNSRKDEIVQAHGVNVLVDPKAVFFLVGTVMDFEETDLSSEFTFNNPNSKGKCGCGESFNV